MKFIMSLAFILAHSLISQAATSCLTQLEGKSSGSGQNRVVKPTPGRKLDVEIVSKIANEGWDNWGVFEVKSSDFPGKRLVAKVSSYQSDFKRIADNNRVLAASTPFAAQYFGWTKIPVNDNGKLYFAYVTEFVEGVVSKSESSLKLIQSHTMGEVETAFRQLLANDVLPLDFQFMITPDGHIKIIDADLYVTSSALLENAKIRDGYTTTRKELDRLLNKMSDPAKSDMIWGQDFFSSIEGNIPARSIKLLKELKQKAAKLKKDSK